MAFRRALCGFECGGDLVRMSDGKAEGDSSALWRWGGRVVRGVQLSVHTTRAGIKDSKTHSVSGSACAIWGAGVRVAPNAASTKTLEAEDYI